MCFPEVQKHALSSENARDFPWMAGTNCPAWINCIPAVYEVTNAVVGIIEEVAREGGGGRISLTEPLFKAPCFKASKRSVYCHSRRKEGGWFFAYTFIYLSLPVENNILTHFDLKFETVNATNLCVIVVLLLATHKVPDILFIRLVLSGDVSG